MLKVWPGTPYPLGATWDGMGTNFSLFSEAAERVELLLRLDADRVRALRVLGARELARAVVAAAGREHGEQGEECQAPHREKATWRSAHEREDLVLVRPAALRLLREDEPPLGDHVELALRALGDRRLDAPLVQEGRETRGPAVVARSDGAVMDLDGHAPELRGSM